MAAVLGGEALVQLGGSHFLEQVDDGVRIGP